MCFELALQLVAKSNNAKTSAAVRTQEAQRALDGVARTIRDENDFALPADAFVLTMRTRAIAQARGGGNRAIVMTDPVCEAAAELAPSGMLNGSLSLASLQSPEDPYIKAANDPSLSAWLNEWQRSRIDVAMLPDRRPQLLQLLGKTRLSCLTLISIGRAISFQSMDDWTEAAFYATAALHGHGELAGYPDGANESRPIIDAFDSVQSRLWKVIDGGDLTFIDALYSLNCDLVRWIPANDGDLQDARAYGLIGRAECLWAMGKNDDAISAAESIDVTSMSIQEKQAAAWIYGLTLFSKDRFSEAIDQFQVVAADPSYKYCEDAYRFLIVSLARSARTDEANYRLDEWIRRYHPNSQQVKSVLARMEIAPAVSLR
jgi:tetratricopeptide (TPR) repeat protein